jgi:hypothetical protein
LALAHTDQELGIVEEFNRNHLVGWSLKDRGKRGREITYVGRILAPVIELGAIAQEDNHLNSELRKSAIELATKAVLILKPYLDEQVVEGSQRYFRNLWTGEHDAINHIATFARACALAFKFSRVPEFQHFAVGFRAYFLAKISVGSNGAYSWPYQVLPNGQHAEPFWKGALTVDALTRMHEIGIELGGEDQGGLVGAFTQLVVRDSYTIHAYLDTRYFPVTAYNSLHLGYSNGILFTPFIVLDRWAPDVRKIILEAVASRRDLFPRGLLLHPSDGIAYAHMLVPAN